MTAIEILMSLVKSFEGCRLKSYLCPAGVWTIGYGSTKGVKKGDTISQLHANELLYKECQQRLGAALKASPKLLQARSGQQAAIADFIFNCGIGNYNSSTLKKDIDRGDFESAARSILRWNKARNPTTGVLEVLPGLTKRRKAEADLL